MELRTVLVDDEQLARDELGYLLGQVGGVEVIGQAGNGVEALATIDRLQPDLVFLDVQMPGLTGFEVARRMIDGGPTSHIIFVTAFDQHAIEAFEVNAVDYLLKPVDPARLDMALQRARRRISFERMNGEQAAGRPRARPGLQPTISSRRSSSWSPSARAGASGWRSRSASGSCSCRRKRLSTRRSPTKASRVVTNQHTGTSNYRTLDELQARLDPAVFWRVHRSHLVNINKIKEIVPWFSRNYILRMKDEKATEIPVSRTQTRRLREYLKL